MAKDFSMEEAQKKILEMIENITESDVKKIVDNKDDILSKLSTSGFKVGAIASQVGNVEQLIEDMKTMLEMVVDYVSGNYKEVPWNTIAAIVVALIYFLSPIDLIPDFIPIVGYTDDITVVLACIKYIKKDLDKYRNWKDSL